MTLLDETDALIANIMTLPQGAREVWVLTMMGFAPAEIAELRCVDPDTVRNQLSQNKGRVGSSHWGVIGKLSRLGLKQCPSFRTADPAALPATPVRFRQTRKSLTRA